MKKNKNSCVGCLTKFTVIKIAYDWHCKTDWIKNWGLLMWWSNKKLKIRDLKKRLKGNKWRKKIEMKRVGCINIGNILTLDIACFSPLK